MLDKKKAAALVSEIKKGRFHTVIVAMPDMQGRWVGKRMTARHFAEVVLEHGTHACAYLLTVDMEMDPLPGFALTSWTKGYQDFTLDARFYDVARAPVAARDGARDRRRGRRGGQAGRPSRRGRFSRIRSPARASAASR